MRLRLAHQVLLGLLFGIASVSVFSWMAPEDLTRWAVFSSLRFHQWLASPGGDGWAALPGLLTHAFLHGDFAHLGMNALYLWIFGGLVGELVGWRWMLAVFALTVIGGGLGFAFLSPESSVIGCSGAVSGFAGAYLGLAVRWQLPWPEIWPIAHPVPPTNLVVLALFFFVSDLLGLTGPDTGIALSAHLGGFLTGAVLTSFFVRPESPHPAR